MAYRINRTAKVTLNPKPDVPEANKTMDADWNETWTGLNSHADDIEANQTAIGSISGGTGDAFETRALAMVSPGADNVPFVVYGEAGFNGQYRYLASDPNGYVNIYLYLTSTDTVTKDSTEVLQSGAAFTELYKEDSSYLTVESDSDFDKNGLTVNSVVSGNFDFTLSRSFPWLSTDTAKYEFILSGSNKYLVIAKTSTTVLTVTLDTTTNSCSIFRFLDNDTFVAVDTSPPNVTVDGGSVITAERNGTIITIYDDGVLIFTYDYSSRGEAEWNDVVFGNLITSNGTQLTGVKKEYDETYSRITRLEDEVFGISEDTTAMQGENMADVGDSIMDQNGMQAILIPRFGIASNQSLAVSGKKFVSGDPESITEQIQNITNSPKLILIGGGTNDFGYDSPLGNIGSSDTTEFYGAVNFVADYVTTNYPNAKIIALTLPFGDWQTPNSFANGQINNIGLSRYDYEKAQIEVYRNHGIPVVKQLSDLGWNLLNIDDKTYDRIHPTTEGSEDRATAMGYAINKVFENN